mmetsp:Transcript_19661/g.47618  ORF Transcript_19661/g.47618 Transcript_19661/m.47618 type:complete len:344 (-) Transcript_19661:756-1787(-)
MPPPKLGAAISLSSSLRDERELRPEGRRADPFARASGVSPRERRGMEMGVGALPRARMSADGDSSTLRALPSEPIECPPVLFLPGWFSFERAGVVSEVGSTRRRSKASSAASCLFERSTSSISALYSLAMVASVCISAPSSGECACSRTCLRAASVGIRFRIRFVFTTWPRILERAAAASPFPAATPSTAPASSGMSSSSGAFCFWTADRRISLEARSASASATTSAASDSFSVPSAAAPRTSSLILPVTDTRCSSEQCEAIRRSTSTRFAASPGPAREKRARSSGDARKLLYALCVWSLSTNSASTTLAWQIWWLLFGRSTRNRFCRAWSRMEGASSTVAAR